MNRGLITGAVFLLGLAVGVVGTRLFWPVNVTSVIENPASAPHVMAPARANVHPFADSSADQTQDDSDTQLRQLQQRYEGLQEERDRLMQENAKLESARVKAEEAQKLATENMKFFGEMTRNLIWSDKVNLPQSMAEAAMRAGQLGRKLTEFKAAYVGKFPAEGSPEYDAYQKQMDALAAEFAPVLKVLGGDDGSAMKQQLSNAQGAAAMQSYLVTGALDLSDQQFQQVYDTLNRYYTDGFNRGLNRDARPATGVDAWVQQRQAQNDQAVTEIKNLLTPSQRADFDKIIGKTLLWQFNIGGGL